MCRALASSQAVRENVAMILSNPVTHGNLYIGALKWASEHGYGKPTESVELTGKDGGPVQLWTFGKRKVAF